MFFVFRDETTKASENCLAISLGLTVEFWMARRSGGEFFNTKQDS